jgi:hypothetical protein
MGKQKSCVSVNCARECYHKTACLPANIAPRAGKNIVDEVTTLRRHLEAKHPVSDVTRFAFIIYAFII